MTADDDIYVYEELTGEYEDCLLGSRRGLMILRDGIDEALESGRGELPYGRIEWEAVVVVNKPEPEEFDVDNKLRLAAMAGILTVILLLLVLIMGGIKIYEVIAELLAK